MTEKEQELHNRAYAEVKRHQQQVMADPYRQSFHLMPPVGLLNDPNGWIQWNGTYHMFYQWNPFAASHGAKFWGHYSSTDMVNWTEEPIALAPSEWFEKNGCYSGSAVDVNGQLTLMYTGNVKDEKGNRQSYQCVATSDDGVHFDKKGPVVDELPEGYTAHFRDPKVWQENGRWYMIIGAQTEDEQGRALLYQSEDFQTWTFTGPLAGAGIGQVDSFGYMWECPDMFSLEGKDILIVSPQGLEPEGMVYHNKYQAGYFIGEANLNDPVFHHGEFTELDRGFEFYAPQTTVDDRGRRIIVGWMGVPEQDEEDHPTIENQWVHCLTIPRELHLSNGRLLQKPVEELKQLRHTPVRFEQKEIHARTTQLDGIAGTTVELLFENLSTVGELFEWTFRGDARLIYNKQERIMTLERKHIKTRLMERRQCYVEQLHDVQIFMDSSSLEIFINGGEEVFTSRYFPDPSDQSITIRSSQPAAITVQKWDLDV
ncbi:sucrose-6-phosphate hydrolase [Salipaludibacillus keqinensis]|uniref:Sucrose-6-phosphate hydrolase n=1 Tax=Salipaludibacillus keqinensis TaxID=2045207 RepID=A0A323T743_9BACI|nr:sucrose-6-phosphate hydrolase [Salipaludibacillus keqinensis]PYZ91619.1 sucrose-6-phosphate hydrolase [Salipaludibacillus keqinensis]